MWKHLQFNPDLTNFGNYTEQKFNEFDILLRSEWDRAVDQGLFSFQIDDRTKRRILNDGDFNYTIIFNPNRYFKRRIPYPFEKVHTPFDKNMFNFNKLQDAEVLFTLDEPHEQIDKNLIVINNSPIDFYHVLLVPDRQLERPQVLTVDCILFGLKFVACSAHPFIIAGFNSLCGYASINHLHLHGMYAPGRMFVQTMKCSPFHEKSNCYLMDFSETHAFAFEIKTIDQFDRITRYVYLIADYLTSRNIAHNMAIVKGESFSSPSIGVIRVFIWIRQSITHGRMFERCNFACVELSGFMPIPYEHVYNELTEVEMRQHLNEIALPLDEQQRIKTDVIHLLDN